MTDFRFDYDQSYPPSLWDGEGFPAASATAGTPGTWLPAGSTPPASVAALQASSITAVPATAWTGLQYVQTGTAGAPGEATWTGTGWVGGRAPATLFAAHGHTIPEVQAHVETFAGTAEEITAETQRVLDDERAGDNRVTLVAWLEERLAPPPEAPA